MSKDRSAQDAAGGASPAPKRKADNDATSMSMFRCASRRSVIILIGSYHPDKRSRVSVENSRRNSTTTTPTSASKSSNATGTAASKKSAGGDLMDSFLAPTASSRPNRPVPTKKPSSNDPLAQAFASIAAAQGPAAEPEPTRKTPDPTRAPRTGRDGKPRAHMTVRWKEGPSLVSIREIEARDPTAVCLTHLCK